MTTMSVVQLVKDNVPQSIHDALQNAIKLLTDLSVNRPILSKIIKGMLGCTSIFIATQIARRIFYTAYFKYKKYPPGPIGLPIFGCFWSKWNFANLNAFPTMLGRDYSPVTMFPYGPWAYTVMISDKKLID